MNADGLDHLMAGIYYGAMYGGSTTSILANIPGEAASVVTCLDGYQVARQGQAGPALGIAAFRVVHRRHRQRAGHHAPRPAAGIGRAPLRPRRDLRLLLLGFTMVTYLAGRLEAQAVAMALVGLLLATVGLDPMTATPRFTYGTIS